MKNRYIASFEAAQIASKEVPAFRAGDTLRLGVEIKEGEKKRVQIAIALYQEIDVLLLDEPTNHLDYKSKNQVLTQKIKF